MVIRGLTGTCNIYEREQLVGDDALHPSLKYDRSTREPTILVPQPSDDPNDPLV